MGENLGHTERFRSIYELNVSFRLHRKIGVDSVERFSLMLENLGGFSIL